MHLPEIDLQSSSTYLSLYWLSYHSKVNIFTHQRRSWRMLHNKDLCNWYSSATLKGGYEQVMYMHDGTKKWVTYVLCNSHVYPVPSSLPSVLLPSWSRDYWPAAKNLVCSIHLPIAEDKLGCLKFTKATLQTFLRHSSILSEWPINK
jgi:hypothetical protein